MTDRKLSAVFISNPVTALESTDLHYVTASGVSSAMATKDFGQHMTGVVDVVRDFDAEGDDVADDTAAFLAAVTAASAKDASVYAPPTNGKYRISSLEVPSNVNIFSDGTWRGGATIRHTDPTKPCFDLLSGAGVHGLRIDVDNTNRVTPTAGPPTIRLNNGYCFVRDVRFEDAYIAVGSVGGGVNNALFADGLRGFVHHRMVLLEDTKDISWLNNLHAQNPDGVAWDSSWYSFDNKVLVEIDDVDGLDGVNWFSFAGRGLFKQSGTGNLEVSLQNVKAENITHGVELVALSENGQKVTIDGGYLQTNGRVDGVYLIDIAQDNGSFSLSNFFLGGSAGADFIRVQDGASEGVNLNAVTLFGSGSTNGLRLYGSTPVSVDNCIFRALSVAVLLETGADNLYFGPGNIVVTGGGVFLSGDTTAGPNDIHEPALYTIGASPVQQTVIRRRTPNHDLLHDVNAWFKINEFLAGVGAGGELRLSSHNNGADPEVQVRARSFGTSGGIGTEAARMYLESQVAGGFNRPIVIDTDGSLQFGDPGPNIMEGTGTPEAARTAPVGSLFLRTDGGASTTLYVKESGAGNTGWVPK